VALDASAWTVDDVHGPNITDKETVLSLARMAANAYVLDDQDSEWYDVGHGFNYTTDFGWKNDGLRGHIFADTENQTVVIAIKGTCKYYYSPIWILANKIQHQPFSMDLEQQQTTKSMTTSSSVAVVAKEVDMAGSKSAIVRRLHIDAIPSALWMLLGTRTDTITLLKRYIEMSLRYIPRQIYG